MAVPAVAGRYPGRVVLSRSTHVADLPRPGGGRTLDSSVTAELTGRGAQRGVSHVARRGSSSRGGFGGQRGRCVRAGGVAAAQWAACGCLAAPGGMALGQTGFDTGGLVGLSGGVLSEVLGAPHSGPAVLPRSLPLTIAAHLVSWCEKRVVRTCRARKPR